MPRKKFKLAPDAARYLAPGGVFIVSGIIDLDVFSPRIFACIAASKGILRLTKKAESKFKSLFIRKEKSK